MSAQSSGSADVPALRTVCIVRTLDVQHAGQRKGRGESSRPSPVSGSTGSENGRKNKPAATAGGRDERLQPHEASRPPNRDRTAAMRIG